MISSVGIFAGTFSIAFGVCVAVVRVRVAMEEAKEELIAQRAQEQKVAEAKSNDMWRANKRLVMR